MSEEQQPRWDDPQVRSVTIVPLGTIVTHVGTRRADGTFKFAETPKWRSMSHDPWVEVDVSMIEGRLEVEDAWRRVRRMTAPAAKRLRDAARYFLADHLYENNYFAMRTPTANIPEHVSVYGDMEEISAPYPDRKDMLIFEQAHRSWWSEPTRVRLEEIELERVGIEDAA
ncbi:hypothetical protein [Rhodococcus sp. UNC363MFTsu5.1]|uniref:hypothetical protein n=1 Tax=Rhodococcus sp. UNC363MFTsu5.1 TaxID=1449069 RepID=UPI0012DFD314|nr:hypothetical protein [Rhodococcus sp. UNC363MFTsu5.1]